MQTILALIFCYLVFVTRTWAITRFVVLIDVFLAIVFDFTPLQVRFGLVYPVAIALTLALWVVNLLRDRAPARP